MITAARAAALKGYVQSLSAAVTLIPAAVNHDPAMRARIVQGMKEARLVDIGPMDYIRLREATARWFTEKIAKVPWRPNIHDDIPKWEMDRYIDTMYTCIPHAPFPRDLPFAATYLFYGGPPQPEIRPKLPMASLDIRDPRHWSAVKSGTVGHLVLDSGYVYEFQDDGGDTIFVHEIRSAEDQEWHCWLSNAPWLINSVMVAIDDAGTLVAERRGLSDRLAFQKFARQARLPAAPPPYYVVTIQPHFIDRVSSGGPPRPKEWSHRWRVREHWLHKLRRGRLPVPEDVLRYCLRVGYRFFHALAPPDPVTMEILRRFNQSPPGPGEWIAVKRKRRSGCIKGPEDKPLVESSYRLGRKTRKELLEDDADSTEKNL
jgi:hypothetical protein